MDKEKIRKELYALLVVRFLIEEDELNDGSANICTDLGLDSLDVVELVEHFEEKYKISIPDDITADVGNMTIDQVVDFVYEATTKYKKS